MISLGPVFGLALPAVGFYPTFGLGHDEVCEAAVDIKRGLFVEVDDVSLAERGWNSAHARHHGERRLYVPAGW